MNKILIQKCIAFFYKNLFGREIGIPETQLESFRKALEKFYDIESLDKWFYWNYFLFQFTYWSGKKTRFEGAIPLNWILGKKAVEKWRLKPENWNYWCFEFLKKRQLELPISFDKFNLREIESIDRKRYYNQEQGFLLCQELDLYDSKHKDCILCKFRKKCQA